MRALFSRTSKNKNFRGSVESSVERSAKAPGVGRFASGDNSKGASKTSAEVLSYLDSCFEELDSDDDVLNNVEHVERQLLERAKKYSNAGFRVENGVEWQPNESLLELVRVAIECSVNVYAPSAPIAEQRGVSCRSVKEITASIDGVTKAVVFYEVRSSDSSNSDFPLLAIAIRGTKTKSLDWLVNLNHEVRDARDVLSLVADVPISQRGNVKIEAHAGYLNSVNALKAPIRGQIDKYRSTPVRHILFTGHSAGGAVASLAFMHVLGLARQQFHDFRLSLITFGAPPVTSLQLTPLAKQLMDKQTKPGFALAIVNNHDPITRTDGAYTKAMINLYNQLGAARGQPESPSDSWAFVDQDLHPFGDLIILKDTSEKDQKDINGYRVEPQSFGRLIFCDRKMHQKSEYMDNIKLLQRQ